MPLSNRQIKAINIGKIYKIQHDRKGTFVGQFMGFDDEPSRLGDKEDKVFLIFKYDIRVGTTQEHMSFGVKLETGEKVPVRVSGLRPSLITEIKQTDDESWLREVKVPEEEKPKQKTGWLDNLLGRK